MISIIIPACNEEAFIEETINSIKLQDFKDYEIVVVCDGCTDKTPEISKKIADKVVILKNRNGPGAAKNAGAEISKYDKLIFLDADTKVTKDVVHNVSKAIDKNLFGTCRIKPSNNKLKHKILMSLKNLYPLPFTNGMLFCSKESFKKANGFPNVKKGEDGRIVKNLKKENKFILLNSPVISSTRRFDKKGYLKVCLYWIKEKIKPSNEDYEVIR